MNRLRTVVFLCCMVGLIAGCGVVPTYAVPPTQDIGQVIAETSAAAITKIAEENPPAATATPLPVVDATLTPESTTENISGTEDPPQLQNIALLLGTLSMEPGSQVYTGEEFQVTWRIRNIGETIWDDQYSLVYAGGEAFGQDLAIPLAIYAAPGDIIDVSLMLTAPDMTGNYRGEWLLLAPDGTPFGVGYENPVPLAVDVIVSYNPVDYGDHELWQLFNGYSTAAWHDQFGPAFCSATGNIGVHGFVTRKETVIFEGTIEENDPTLVLQPPDGEGGFIEGIFPPYRVSAGNYFTTRVGCLDENHFCDVTIQILIQVVGESSVEVYWEGTKTFDGDWIKIHQPLEKYRDQDIVFIFRVENNGNATDDVVGFFAPVILH